MQGTVPVTLLTIRKGRIRVSGFETGETEHVGHESFLVIIDAGNCEYVLLCIVDTSDQAVGVSLETVQDKPVAGNVPPFTAEAGEISWFYADTVFEFTV